MKRLRAVSSVVSFLLIASTAHVFAGDGDDGKDCALTDSKQRGAAPEEAQMYLCLDQSGRSADESNGGHVKMVYTYVNGKRTECVTENEFLNRFRSPALLPPPPTLQDRAQTAGARPDYAGRDFSEQDMFGMDLQFADLHDANFYRADMRGINLRAADCSGANFEEALVKGGNLHEADLSDARLKGTYFVRTDLSGAKGLTIESLRLANCLYNCRLDDEILEQLNKYCPSKFRDVSWNWAHQEAERRGLR